MNRLLAVLPAAGRRRLLANCQDVELTLGDVLWEPSERIRHVYFPLDSIISLLIPVDGRGSLEVLLIGNEGMLGVPPMLGIDVSPLPAIVQGSGTAVRMTAVALRREQESNPALQRVLNRYTYVLLEQLAQSTACISFHALEARLARWLLMTHDRAHSNAFHLTHELLAQMLGVRRVGITNAAGSLQKQKLLSYSRGEITVLNRIGLEAVSCSCYQATSDTYERVFG